MLIGRKLCGAVSRVGSRGHKNMVTSETLSSLEAYCEKVCPPPRIPPHKVAVVGAGSPVGRVVSLLLKQQPLVKVLALYDVEPTHNVVGVAQDIAHIDTSTQVEAYQGRTCIRPAVHDADVVLICGGTPAAMAGCEKELFLHNMYQVYMATRAVARYAPRAILAVQTPPVDCNFSLAMHTLKLTNCYDKRRLLGVNSVTAMRANQLLSQLTGGSVAGGSVAVVCGCGRCTRVPVFKTNPKKLPENCVTVTQSQLDHATYLVREADVMIASAKCCTEEAHLSTGHATAQCVVSLLNGLFKGGATLESALVEQGDPAACYGMPVCATPVTVGPRGIETYIVPELSPNDMTMLQAAKCDLDDLLNLGRCFAVGDEYYLPTCKCLPPPPPSEPSSSPSS